MENEEYQEFEAWWKAQWPMSAPHRISIEMYERWKEEEDKARKED
uniref:Uncharacterized protein n=1 Tax=viral metagenome TaxID=1070528 RepID=A0A6M3KAT2_9ZZZZ